MTPISSEGKIEFCGRKITSLRSTSGCLRKSTPRRRRRTKNWRMKLNISKNNWRLEVKKIKSPPATPNPKSETTNFSPSSIGNDFLSFFINFQLHIHHKLSSLSLLYFKAISAGFTRINNGFTVTFFMYFSFIYGLTSILVKYSGMGSYLLKSYKTTNVYLVVSM